MNSRKYFSSVALDLDDLAPISVSVYTRLHHFRQCIESLAKNPLAKESVLYIFSDAAKPGDENAVEEVRAYANSIAGFKKIILCYKEKNNRLENMKDAREIPLIKHKKMIRMEDDNIVSETFLTFMNEALEYYKNDPSVLSVSGYSAPINQKKYVNGDVYLSYFYSGWTIAAWLHKPFLEFLAKDSPYKDMVDCELEKYVSKIHPKLHVGLRKIEDDKEYFAGDQLLTYYMIKHRMFQIRPVLSLVRNIGHDGSGVHCGVSNQFDQPCYEGVFDVRMNSNDYVPEIDKLQINYFKQRRNIFVRMVSKLSRLWSAYVGNNK